jgi:hypothetical protein
MPPALPIICTAVAGGTRPAAPDFSVRGHPPLILLTYFSRFRIQGFRMSNPNDVQVFVRVQVLPTAFHSKCLAYKERPSANDGAGNSLQNDANAHNPWPWSEQTQHMAVLAMLLLTASIKKEDFAEP